MKRFILSVLYLLSLHVSGLVLLTLFRLITFIENYHSIIPEFRHDGWLQSIAFVRGIWFDNVVGCYILLLPLVVVCVASLFQYYGKRLYAGISVYFMVMYAVTFAVSAANIPYFEYFFKNINSSIFNWMDYGGTTFGMIFGESSFYFPILYFLITSVGFVFIVLWEKRLYFKRIDRITSVPRVRPVILGTQFICSVLLIGLCVFGIRGRTGYNPIKVSAAYYCNDPFLNQLGINPTFNLLNSTLDDRRAENRYLSLMPEKEAIEKVRKYLAVSSSYPDYPLMRKIDASGKPLQANVVLIFMESMSANFMAAFGQTQGLTPNLDSLYRHSLSFNRFYSAGIHTNHGLYATLYSYPAIMKRNAMKGSVIPLYSGLPTVLKDNGYTNLFFMTHESQYDNMNAFLRTNGYDEIYSQENYPKEKVVNSFGVQDDFLFEYALPVLNEKADGKSPFFATLLTISNHPPYVIPSYFHPHSKDPEMQIVEYADWSIGKFMEEAEKQPWFDNTIFVFVGDHGKKVGDPDCEMPQSYNHIPLMIYSRLLPNGQKDCFGGQVDIAPTLLGLLNISYVRNNFGVDLLNEERPCMFFTADNMIGCRDREHFYIYSPESKQEFYYLEDNNKLVAAGERKNDAEFAYLRDYCFSMLQAAESLVRARKTTDKIE